MKRGKTMLHNYWSQGQLFAFSALDGTSFASDDFVGTLCGDKIGIRFYTKIKRELVLVNKNNLLYEFNAVLSDYINIKYENNKKVEVIYADQHLVVGGINEAVFPIVNVEGVAKIYLKDKITIHNSYDNDFTALYVKNNKFAFAYGNSEEDVIDLVKKGITFNLEDIINEKIKIYKQFSLEDCNPYSKLYSKCLSTMKTQLYSPEGVFKRTWSTPNRLPHRHFWLWDSVFHAIGFKNISTEIAEDLILALFDVQDANGFIPHCSTVNDHSAITQPPVIAWGAYEVYKNSKNKSFLKYVFDSNKKFLLWCKENRKLTDRELYTWNTQSDVNCRCDESGMDNSPRFDIKKRLFAIDFSCFMANETRYMKKIAEELNLKEDAKLFEDWNSSIKHNINELLWCKKDNFYYDYIIDEEKLSRVKAVSSFLPLFSGVCDNKKAKFLYNELKNPKTFYTQFLIPSISKDDKSFGTDMWRGPVWINYNYMISLGLKEYGYAEFANEIIEKTIKVIDYWYNKKGTIFEFYDCDNVKSPNELNRKGSPIEPYDFKIKYQTIREYGWSNTLLFDILNEKYNSNRK